MGLIVPSIAEERYPIGMFLPDPRNPGDKELKKQRETAETKGRTGPAEGPLGGGRPVIRDPVVMLDNLVLSLSDSLDLVHHCAADHQQRVAYVALRMAQAMGYNLHDRADLMYAAALHDIGVLSVEEKIESIQVDSQNWQQHAELGAALLSRLEFFGAASELVRLHHQSWSDDAGWNDAPAKVRLSSNAIHVADYVDRIVRKDVDILSQVKGVRDSVSQWSGSKFAPKLVDCFLELTGQESFWLDFASPRIYTVLTGMVVWPHVELRMDGLEQIGQIFSRIVDFRSPFTATHSIGVATTAEELARRLGFEDRECRLIRIAGHLHDLGKVAVPNSILEKPAKLAPSEFHVIRGHTYHTYHILSTIGGFEEINMWASFHHERLNGDGYPFHHKGDVLPLGSRIMCVADVFTAMAENRPYREGTGRKENMPILSRLVRNGGLDARIVNMLGEEYEEIDEVRSTAQVAYAAEYERRFPNRNAAGIT